MRLASLGAVVALLSLGCGGVVSSGVPEPAPTHPATSTPPTAGTTPVASPPGPAADGKTTGGVTLPVGWTLKVSDHFGNGAGSNLGTYAELHAKYFEGQYYNRGPEGLVSIPNVTINNEQEQYVHFESAIAFSADHLTILARGQPDGTITSGEIVSRFTARSWCVEGRYRTPGVDKAWPALWFYGDAEGHDNSEIDIEQPLTPNQGVHEISLYNHPGAASLNIADSHFTTAYMTWSNPAFDASAAPHVYTTCYDDSASQVTRYIDAALVYSATWKWNDSLGGTAHGPDASTIVNLAVGGAWPGNTSDPVHYSADLDLYSLEYYGP